MAHGEIHPDEEDPNVLTFDKNPNSPSVSGNDSLGPASVWFPDYDRRHAGTIAPTGLAAGQQVSNLGDPFGNRIFNNLSQSQAISEWDDSTGYLTLALKEDLDKMAKEMGTSSSTGKGLWTRAVTNSFNASKKGRRVSPFESIQNIANDYYEDPENKKKKDKKGSSAYTGPVQTNTISTMDDRDVEITLNEFATEMLGRNLTKKELNKYSNKFKKQDSQAQTNLRVPNGPAQVTSATQEKVTRETIAKDIVRENPDYAKNVINTDVLEMFANRLGL
jgi:hypothetical protein